MANHIRGDAGNRTEGQEGGGGGTGLARSRARGKDRGGCDRTLTLLRSTLCSSGEAGRDGGRSLRTTTRPSTWSSSYPGTGSTDFWGISFAFSSIDQQAMSGEALERELTLMRACWAFFDDVRSRVSAEMQQGPRGGGRDRDRIVRHIFANEQDWAKKLGVTHA